MTQEKQQGAPKKAAKTKQNTHLEKLVSQTKKFKVEDLLDLYKVYDALVIDLAFRQLLLPYSRFARTWLRDQMRDLLAGTDRNRLILTSRARKAAEAAYETMDETQRDAWCPAVKARHTIAMVECFRLLQKVDSGEPISADDIQKVGISRLVYDDLGAYFSALMNSYPALVADYLAAKCEGDADGMAEIDAKLRCLEIETGVARDDAWYVSVNVRSIYDQIERMVQVVTLSFTRILFRFAHGLRGVTSTEENFSAGYEGLIRAARNYDPSDGSSFAAHCQWWVRSAVLQKQRQSSVILLPPSTWHRLNQLYRGEIEMSDGQVSDLKERAEMFYANSQNASKMGIDSEDSEDFSFESVRVTSPDAGIVMGDALSRSQGVEEVYEATNTSNLGAEVFREVITLLHEEDPSLLFSVLLWASNSGIDSTLVGQTVSPLFVSEMLIQEERVKHLHIAQNLTTQKSQMNQTKNPPKKKTKNGKPPPRYTEFQQQPLG